jgi:hypothetical protein
MVGIAFGADHPTRLKALVGTGSFPFIDFTDLPSFPKVEQEVQRLVASGGVVRDLERHMAQTGERFPDPIDRNVRETLPRKYALDEVAWRSWRGPRSAYPTFPAPVLAITGEREDSNRQSERFLAMMPDGRIVRLAGLGHLGAFYRGDLALPHTIPFLQRSLGDL